MFGEVDVAAPPANARPDGETRNPFGVCAER
ncbi:hypothetical protein AVEN_170908-1, partial [Araneus ventricosus]